MAKETRLITPEIINSTKYIIGYSDKPESVISMLCAQSKITEEFVNTFIEYITPSIFSKSYKLEMSLAERFPSLFSEDEYKEYGSEEELEFIISRMSVSGLAKYIDDPVLKIREHPGEVIKSLRQSDNSEFKNQDDVFALLGISEQIDEILLMKCQSEDISNIIALTLKTENKKISPALAKYLTQEAREALLNTSKNAKDLIISLCDSKDLGWKLQSIRNAVSQKDEYTKYTGTMDNALNPLIQTLPEDIICELVKLSEIMPNAFNYNVLSTMLDSKSFSEEQLLGMKDLFKKAGVGIKLKLYAKNNSMENLYKSL